MGHIHLATLPGTRRWREVVQLLDDRADTDAIVGASAVAAEKDFAVAAGDPNLARAVRLLALIPQAARGSDFGEQLRLLGMDVPDDPTLGHLVIGIASTFEGPHAIGSRSDFSEIVRRALVGTVSAEVGKGLPGLFEAEPDDVRRAAAKLGRPDEFSRVTRAFFGRLLTDTLGSWLDRTLSAEVGKGARIESLAERDAFDGGLEQYCSEATRIIREFSGAWYGKTLYREGTITPDRAGAFAAVAVKKIVEELRRKRLPRA